jgi:hypothetical protein
MSDKDLEDLKAAIRRIELAIIGDQAMGQLGIIRRLNNHGERIKQLENFRWKWVWLATGALVVVTVLYGLLRDWLK